MIEQFLEYQNLDAELLKLEKQIKGNENKHQAGLMIQFINQAQKKINQMDSVAGKIAGEIEKLAQVKDKGIAIVEKYQTQETDNLDEEQLRDLATRTNRAIGNLREIEKRLLSQAEKVGAVLKDFELTKKKIILAKQKHKENKEAYEGFLKEVNPQIKKLQADLKKKETGLDKTLFTKYISLRKDGVFPIVVSLNNNACGGCRMGLPSSTLERIKTQGYLQCEQCRRVIYSK